MSKSATRIEGSVFQDHDGNWWLRRSDRAEDRPFSDLEVRRFIQCVVEHAQIAEIVDELAAKFKAAGIPLPDHVRETVIRNAHKAARERGITKPARYRTSQTTSAEIYGAVANGGAVSFH